MTARPRSRLRRVLSLALGGLAACAGPPFEHPTPATSPEPVFPASAPTATPSLAAASGATLPAPAADAGTTTNEPASSKAPATPGPLAAVLSKDSESVQELFDDASHAPVAMLHPKGLSDDDPLLRGLKASAVRVAAGMQPDGPAATGTLKEKQSVQTDVTLQPGRCYAVVAYSRSVRDVDLYLLLSPGILSAQDTTDDSSPTLGGPMQPICPAAAVPITYKLAIVADRGAGDVAMQVYSKSK